MHKPFSFDEFQPDPEYSNDLSVRLLWKLDKEQKARKPYDEKIDAAQKDFFRVSDELKEVQTKLKGNTGIWEFFRLQLQEGQLSYKFYALHDRINNLYRKRTFAS